MAAASGGGVVGVRADPVHPGVDLEVDRAPAAWPDPAATRLRAAMPAGGVDGRDQAAGHGFGHPLHRVARTAAGSAPRSPPRAGPPPPRRGPPPTRWPRPRAAARATGTVAVAVAVRLDHRAQGRRPDQVGEHAGVVPHGVEVDVGPRRRASGQPRRPPRRRPGRRPRAASTVATRSGRSPATVPSPRAGAPARPWTWAARAAASSGSTPAGQEGPDDARTARPRSRRWRGRWCPARASRTRPSGCGHGRGRSLEQGHRPGGCRPGRGRRRSGRDRGRLRPAGRTRRRGG